MSKTEFKKWTIKLYLWSKCHHEWKIKHTTSCPRLFCLQIRQFILLLLNSRKKTLFHYLVCIRSKRDNFHFAHYKQSHKHHWFPAHLSMAFLAPDPIALSEKFEIVNLFVNLHNMNLFERNKLLRNVDHQLAVQRKGLLCTKCTSCHKDTLFVRNLSLNQCTFQLLKDLWTEGIECSLSIQVIGTKVFETFSILISKKIWFELNNVQSYSLLKFCSIFAWIPFIYASGDILNTITQALVAIFFVLEQNSK